MPKDAHSKAADHHDNAARSHRMAAEHRAKGDHAKGGGIRPGAQQVEDRTRALGDG